MKIMYVEDSLDHVQTLRRIITHFNHQLITAPTAHEGHSLLTEQPDLILLDLTLPDMNGLDLARQIRAEGHTTPIIALTADVLLYNAEQAQRAGCDAFIVKPYTVEQLMDLLKRFAPQ